MSTLHRMGSASLKRLFLMALVTALCGTGALAILSILGGEFNGTNGRILAATALAALYSLLAARGNSLRRSTLADACLDDLGAHAGRLFLRHGGRLGRRQHWDWGVTVTAFAAACSQTAALSHTEGEDSASLRWLHLSSVILAFSFASFLSLAVMAHDWGNWQLLGILGVADVVCTLIQPLIRRMERMGGAVPTASPVGYRLVFALDSEPSPQALAAARNALSDVGARVERIERPGYGNRRTAELGWGARA